MTTDSWPREWVAVMPGDVVRDGAGVAYLVTRAVPEGAGVWVELDGGGGRGVRSMYVPDARARVEMTQGPGWGMSACDDAAMTWAAGLVGGVLGATVEPPTPP